MILELSREDFIKQEVENSEYIHRCLEDYRDKLEEGRKAFVARKHSDIYFHAKGHITSEMLNGRIDLDTVELTDEEREKANEGLAEVNRDFDERINRKIENYRAELEAEVREDIEDCYDELLRNAIRENNQDEKQYGED